MALQLETVREIGARVAAEFGLEIWDVELRSGTGKQGHLLRIFIDRPAGSSAPDAGSGPQEHGVTLDDCANVSREVSAILDAEGFDPGGEYVLEVSSPGLDRKLTRPEDFKRFTGSRVKLMTREPVGVTEASKGNRHWEGRLTAFRDGRLTLELSPGRKDRKDRSAKAETRTVEIDWSNIERANLAPEF